MIIFILGLGVFICFSRAHCAEASVIYCSSQANQLEAAAKQASTPEQANQLAQQAAVQRSRALYFQGQARREAFEREALQRAQQSRR